MFSVCRVDLETGKSDARLRQKMLKRITEIEKKTLYVGIIS